MWGAGTYPAVHAPMGHPGKETALRLPLRWAMPPSAGDAVALAGGQARVSAAVWCAIIPAQQAHCETGLVRLTFPDRTVRLGAPLYPRRASRYRPPKL